MDPNQQYYGGYPPQGGYSPQEAIPQVALHRNRALWCSGYGAYDDPEGQPKHFSFNDMSIRKGFLRKVYMILMGELVVTVIIVCL